MSEITAKILRTDSETEIGTDGSYDCAIYEGDELVGECTLVEDERSGWLVPHCDRMGRRAGGRAPADHGRRRRRAARPAPPHGVDQASDGQGV